MLLNMHNFSKCIMQVRLCFTVPFIMQYIVIIFYYLLLAVKIVHTILLIIFK